MKCKMCVFTYKTCEEHNPIQDTEYDTHWEEVKCQGWKLKYLSVCHIMWGVPSRQIAIKCIDFHPYSLSLLEHFSCEYLKNSKTRTYKNIADISFK